MLSSIKTIFNLCIRICCTTLFIIEKIGSKVIISQKIEKLIFQENSLIRARVTVSLLTICAFLEELFI